MLVRVDGAINADQVRVKQAGVHGEVRYCTLTLVVYINK